MIKKTVVATISALAVAAGAAYADTGAGSGDGSVESQINSLQSQINQLQHQIAQGGKGGSGFLSSLVSSNPELTRSLLGVQHGVGDELTLLEARNDGLITGRGVTFGGEVQADAFYQHRNNTGTPFINPALPLTAGGKSASRIALTSVQLHAIAAINDWTTAYVQLYQGLVGLNIDNASARTGVAPHAMAFRDAYLVFGNLAENPLYGFIGRGDVNFGSFETVNMYNVPLDRALFRAHGNQVGLGFSHEGFTSVISVMNGGDHTGVADIQNIVTYDNLYTSNNQHIGNAAFNVGYGVDNSDHQDHGNDVFHDMSWHVGAGVLRGSQYTKSNGTDTNAAWDVNGKVSIASFDVLGEFVRNFSENQANKTVNAWNLGTAYNFVAFGKDSVFSLSYSAEHGDNSFNQFRYSSATPVATDHVNAQQAVAGLRADVLPNVTTGVEYAYNRAAFTAAAGNKTTNWNTITLDVTAAF